MGNTEHIAAHSSTCDPYPFTGVVYVFANDYCFFSANTSNESTGISVIFTDEIGESPKILLQAPGLPRPKSPPKSTTRGSADLKSRPRPAVNHHHNGITKSTSTPSIQIPNGVLTVNPSVNDTHLHPNGLSTSPSAGM